VHYFEAAELQATIDLQQQTAKASYLGALLESLRSDHHSAADIESEKQSALTALLSLQSDIFADLRERMNEQVAEFEAHQSRIFEDVVQKRDDFDRFKETMPHSELEDIMASVEAELDKFSSLLGEAKSSTQSEVMNPTQSSPLQYDRYCPSDA